VDSTGTSSRLDNPIQLTVEGQVLVLQFGRQIYLAPTAVTLSILLSYAPLGAVKNPGVKFCHTGARKNQGGKSQQKALAFQKPG